MSEFKLVPAKMLLDKETIGAINFHCGDGGDNFGEHSDGLLWIGVVTDDEGKEVYGLHLSTAEYPEEGSTTLVEFNAPEDAAQSDLAALREELAKAQALSVTNIMMDVVPGYDGMGLEVYAKSVAEVGLLISNLYLAAEERDERLTAAEQRNAELELMLESVRMNSKELLAAWVPSDWEAKRALLLSGAKPTESGASEYLESCKAADESLRVKP